jgi:hypothetical protein
MSSASGISRFLKMRGINVRCSQWSTLDRSVAVVTTPAMNDDVIKVLRTTYDVFEWPGHNAGPFLIVTTKPRS